MRFLFAEAQKPNRMFSIIQIYQMETIAHIGKSYRYGQLDCVQI